MNTSLVVIKEKCIINIVTFSHIFGCTCSPPGITTYLHNRQYCKTKIAQNPKLQEKFLTCCSEPTHFEHASYYFWTLAISDAIVDQQLRIKEHLCNYIHKLRRK